MIQYFGCNAHKKYSLFVAIDEAGHLKPPVRVEHERDLLRQFLSILPPGSQIAVESVGNWYWLIDEMENAGHVPLLATQPRPS